MFFWLSTGGWRVLEDDRLGGATHMYGRDLLLLLHDSLIQRPFWPFGQRPSNFHLINVECCWGCLIRAIFFRIQFQLVLEATRIWRIWVGHSCATYSTVTLQRCWVGVPGAKKVARMASLQNSTPTCDRRSFRDVVASAIGTAEGSECPPPSGSSDMQAAFEGGADLPPCNLLPVFHQVEVGRMESTASESPADGQCSSGWQTVTPRHSLRAIHQTIRMNNEQVGASTHLQTRLSQQLPGLQYTGDSKENLQSGSAGAEVQPLKPKRKYVRKQQSGGGEQGVIGGEADNLGEVRDPTARKAKRAYTRKEKVDVPVHEGVGSAALTTMRRRGARGGHGGARRGGRASGTGVVPEVSNRPESPELLPPDSRGFSPPATRARFNHSSRVRVLLRDLQWGGEVLPVPCPYAIGTILEREQGADGIARLQCDFGVHLGVQSVLQSSCEAVVFERVDDVEDCEQVGGEYVAPPSWELLDTDSEHDWDPALSDLGSESHHGLSSGASSVDIEEDDPVSLLGELGIYPVGPEPERFELDRKYADSNWHARMWSLLPRQPFAGKPPGASEALPTDILMEPVEYFLLFWDEMLQRKIVRESNDYADYIDPATGKRKGGESAAMPITHKEFRQFTGICCLMGVRDQPCIRDYWRRVHGALFCEDVASTMSRWRFEYILRCLHMTSKYNFVTDKRSPDYDPIGKCRWILEHVEARFQHFWNLSPYATVDECMVAYNGRFCSFKQYLPAKPITHGIKIWAMACSITSYVYKLEIYVGKGSIGLAEAATTHIGMAGQVVARLTKGLEGLWYPVTCDNYFTSPYLFDDLLGRGFYAVGTARKQRKGFPTSLCISHDQPRGTLHTRVHRDLKMAAILWQDTKGVYFLATAADPMVVGGVVTSRVSGQRIAEIPTSPIQILYSQMMGGVDVGDQNRSYYSTQIATKKWWHRVYFFCLDSSIANAFTIHKETAKRLGEKPLSHKEFQLRIAYDLMGRPYRAAGAKRNVQAIRRIPPQPFDSGIPHVPRKTNLRRVCRICKRRTRWICPQCDGVRLCTSDCFEFFHTRGTVV